jgi:DNA replication protein DnaC
MIQQTLYEKLLRLRLPAFRAGLQEQAANPQYAELSFEERLLLLVEQECTRRADSRLKHRLKEADFPFRAAIPDLDFSPERGLDRRQVLELAHSTWIDQALNILVLGATGTGKTFVSSALGHAACQAGYTVRYVRTSRLLLSLEHARQDGSYLSLLRSLTKSNLLIFDDWLRDPVPLSAAQHLLEIFDDRFGKASTLIATQLPVSEWHTRFPDPTLADAILDRLVHNAHRLNLAGESQRKLRSFRSMPHS